MKANTTANTTAKNKRELLEFCFKQGEKNFNFELDCKNALVKESYATLNFIVSFGGASFFGIVNFINNERYDIVIGLVGLIIYFFVTAYLLIQKCLLVRPIAPPANDPMNLYQPNFNLTQIMDVEINQLKERMKWNNNRNKEAGRWLNRVRYMLFASPIIFLVGLGVYWFPYQAIWNWIQAGCQKMIFCNLLVEFLV